MAILIDTNLLLLLAVGHADLKYIALHKRLNDYTIDDYTLLENFLTGQSRLVVTPHVLTETSNLAGYVAEPARTKIFRSLKKIIASCQERHHPAIDAVDEKEFIRLGLTDAVLLMEAREPCTLLTADLALFLAAARQGSNAVNFNNLRDTDD